MNKPHLLWVGMVLLCIVTNMACHSQDTELLPSPEENQSRDVTLSEEQQQAIGLSTAPAEERKIGPVIESFGRIIPRVQGRVQVTSPVPGRVTPQSVERIPAPGTVVRQGQVLAEVEQTYTVSERVQLDVGEEGAGGAAAEAKAALDVAVAEYQRSQNLFAAKIVAHKRVEEAKASWLQAQSRYETAKRQEASYQRATTTKGEPLRRVALTAPITGVIVQADLTAGQQVDTVTPLFVITDPSIVWAEAPIFEGDLHKLQQTRTAVIRTVGEDQQSWTGRLLYTGTVVDPIKRTASLVYEVDNKDGRLKLGMSVMVTLPTGAEHPAVMVPETALLESEKGKGVVYVRRNATQFSEKEVQIGDRRDRFVAIAGDIKAGEELVVIGVPELFGMRPGRLAPKETEEREE